LAVAEYAATQGKSNLISVMNGAPTASAEEKLSGVERPKSRIAWSESMATTAEAS